MNALSKHGEIPSDYQFDGIAAEMAWTLFMSYCWERRAMSDSVLDRYLKRSPLVVLE